jgi:hypothetical protein
MTKENKNELIKSINRKFKKVNGFLNEKGLRVWAAAEAEEIGHSGQRIVHKATGIAVSTIRRGLIDLENGEAKKDSKRIRRKGSGRKKLLDTIPELEKTVETLIDGGIKGDPESPLRWSLKSVRELKRDLLNTFNIKIGVGSLWKVLKDLGYRLRFNNKTLKAKEDHPDRNKQFECINSLVKKTMKRKDPVISVDTKKRERIGNFKNQGREWGKEAVKVLDHDFPTSESAAPFGILDIAKNAGFINVGKSHDTAQFAVASITKWWMKIGKKIYSKAKGLLIVADSGGSNGYRNNLWKYELQKLADKTGLKITVSHFPPGTSKWNKIEHRLFSFISMNWRGKPLISYETIVNLIRSTKTSTGLKVKCQLDEKEHPTKIKISKETLESICITRNAFHGEWNYTISPRKK